MKTNIRFRFGAYHLFFLMIVFLMITARFSAAQSNRDVIAGYVGWAGNPDSLTVYIDDSFSAAEKDSVREGMKRWNDAGGKPKFKEVATKPAKITVKEGDPGGGNAGVAAIRTDGDGKVTEVEITIRNNPNPGLKETATHELGHAIGLDDTDEAKNPGDVMKGTGPSNGSDGNLSKHDSTELRAAIASITNPAPAGNIPKKKRVTSPPTAIQPGQSSNLQFDLGFPFPPATGCSVIPAGDDLFSVNSFNLVGNLLQVNVTIDPQHGSGKAYLMIQVTPPFPNPNDVFIGEFFVNSVPVEPLTFQCPCEIYEENGRVHVDWKEFHNYPFPVPLRAYLNVDGNTLYHARGGDNFLLDLAPGLHTFTLMVDDFQINDCSFTATHNVQGGPLVPLAGWAIMIGLFMILAMTIFRIRSRGN
jgi:hypothetical protein